MKQSKGKICNICTYVSPADYNRFLDYFRQSTCRSISEYAAKILLKGPVYIKYRNESADEFLAIALELKEELNTLCRNYEVAIRHLRKLSLDKEIREWIVVHEITHKEMREKVKDIYEEMEQIYQQWLVK